MVVAAHGDSFAAKRMRKLTQRRAVDYTSTVVRYMQVMFVMDNHPQIFGLYLKILSHLSYRWHFLLKFLQFVWIPLLTLLSSESLLGCLSWYGHQLLSEMKIYQICPMDFVEIPFVEIPWCMCSSGFFLFFSLWVFHIPFLNWVCPFFSSKLYDCCLSCNRVMKKLMLKFLVIRWIKETAFSSLSLPFHWRFCFLLFFCRSIVVSCVV